MQIFVWIALAVMYVVACVAVALVVGVPAALVLGSVAAATGALGALGLITAAYVGTADDQDEPADQGVAAHVLPGRPPAVEPAWRHYLSAQWSRDVRAAYDRVDDVNSRMWTRVNDLVGGAMSEFGAVLWPVAWVPYVVAAAATAGAAVAGAVTAAVVAVPAGLVWLLRTGWVRVARLGERSRQRRLRSSATCTAEGCDDVSNRPVVECACGRRHHGLEPGPFGALRRRCSCGRLLRTTLTAAAADGRRMRCPRCDAPLPAGTMTDADVRIAVLGAPGSGRSLLVGAGLDDLCAAVRSRGGRVEEIGSEIGPAPVDRTCRSVRLRPGRRWVTLHVHDPIGDALDVPARRRRLHHLRYAQGVLLVIDVVALPRVAGRVPEGPAPVDPEHVYRATVAHLRDDRVDLNDRALAVVLRRVDVAAAAGVPAPPDGAGSAQLRTWLGALGADNLTVAAERDFGSVRWFRSDSSAEGDAAAAALTWLAGVVGVDLRPWRRHR